LYKKAIQAESPDPSFYMCPNSLAFSHCNSIESS